MNYTEFVDVIFGVVKKEIPAGISVKKTEVVKNNGLRRTGLSFYEEGLNAAPTLYLEGFFEHFNLGTSMEDIAEMVLCSYFKTRLKNKIDVGFFMNYEEARETIFCKLINYELNKELLASVPYVRFLDLAIVSYCRLDKGFHGEASILIRNEHLLKWGIDSATLFKDARDNTRYKMNYSIRNITTILKDFAPQEDIADSLMDAEVPMYVLTNKQNYYGAVYMIFDDILKEFCEMFDGDLCVIPSSVHETIIVPDREAAFMCVDEMIKEVNNEHVEEEERLSDHAYHYRREGGFLI